MEIADMGNVLNTSAAYNLDSLSSGYEYGDPASWKDIAVFEGS